jgi:hypothetical protein
MKYRITDIPHHTHDCSECYHVGTLVNRPNTGAVDVYLHAGSNSTLIARTGSEGWDYLSMPLALMIALDKRGEVNAEGDLGRAYRLLQSLS